ncbi:MAG: TRAP transporter small permease subunit [Halothiobacillaceae bacterium]
MDRTIALIDGINEWIGRAAGVLALAMAVAMLAVVVLRYLFSMSFPWLSESVLYLHGLVFMLGIAYTLRHGGHVRVDVIQRQRSQRTRAWIEITGTVLFLWPVAIFLLVMNLPYVEAAWRIHEGAREPGGIPYLYLLKTLLIVMPILLMLQGLAELLRAWRSLAGGEGIESDGPVHEAEEGP